MLKSVASLDIRTLNDFPEYKAPEEKGATFEENALLKATHAAKALNKWVLADDSGLCVVSLKGAPGIHSARYAGASATDKDNRKKLLEALKGKQGLERSAYFECCLVLASPKDEVKVFKGTCEGFIANEECGKNGFGYDPLFIKYDYNQTFAELDESTKNRVSHRRKAVDKFMSFLESHALH